MSKPPRTILYIEDDPASRRLIERLLTHAGYRVLLAENGLTGIDIARTEKPDLILTDINLPDLSGNEITTTLRNDDAFQDTPIVALTAQGASAQAMAMAAGITGFLTKPINIERFTDQMQFYLDGGRDTLMDTGLLRDAQTQYTREVVSRLEKRIRSLEESNSGLKRLDRMKATFIKITAHELRTPLTVLYGYLRLLEDHAGMRDLLASDDNLQELMGGMSGAIKRMQDMVEEIMTMSRIMTRQIDLSLTPVSLPIIIKSAVRHYQEAIDQRGLKVDLDIADWPRQMQGDSGLLQVVMGNLLSNAIKYTPDNGKISVSVETTDTHTCISVRDSGVGVAPSECDKIFEQFYTSGDTELHSTSKTAFLGGGLGLGLPIVRGIVTAHGGEVSVESVGHDPQALPGSCFTVRLPIKAERPATKANGTS